MAGSGGGAGVEVGRVVATTEGEMSDGAVAVTPAAASAGATVAGGTVATEGPSLGPVHAKRPMSSVNEPPAVARRKYVGKLGI